jgi:hypothetical protein
MRVLARRSMLEGVCMCLRPHQASASPVARAGRSPGIGHIDGRKELTLPHGADTRDELLHPAASTPRPANGPKESLLSCVGESGHPDLDTLKGPTPSAR